MTKPLPRLTKEAFHESLKPPNLCRVRELLDSMDDDSREVLEEALALTKAEYPAAQVVQLLIGAGYDENKVPGIDAINDHRNGRRPCRCRG